VVQCGSRLPGGGARAGGAGSGRQPRDQEQVHPTQVSRDASRVVDLDHVPDPKDPILFAGSGSE